MKKPEFENKLGLGWLINFLTIISAVIGVTLWFADTRNTALDAAKKVVAVAELSAAVADKMDTRMVKVIDVLTDIKTGLAVQGQRLDDHGRRLDVLESRSGPPR